MIPFSQRNTRKEPSTMPGKYTPSECHTELLTALKAALETLYATRERFSCVWTQEDEASQSETEEKILAAIARADNDKVKRLMLSAPKLLAALKDLLGDVSGDVWTHECVGCGRHYPHLPDRSYCESRDCPRCRARAAIEEAEGDRSSGNAQDALLKACKSLVGAIVDERGGADLLPVNEAFDPENYKIIMAARAAIAMAEEGTT
jgi:hypothetical protein